MLLRILMVDKTFDRCFAKPQDVLVQELSGEAVLLNLRSGHYFGLNPMGLEIWNQVSNGATIAACVEQLQQQFDVERDRLQQDVVALVGELLSHELLESVHG